MTNTSAIQTDYRYVSRQNKPGAAWRRGIVGKYIKNAVNTTLDVGAVVDATAVNNAGDISGLYIDGALFEITSTASTAADVTAMKARLDAAVIQGSLPAGTTVVAADPKITINFGDFGPHEVVAFSPLTADWTPIATVTKGSAAKAMIPGMWVVFDPQTPSNPTVTPVKCADAAGQIVAGLVHDDNRFPRHTDPDSSSGLVDPQAIPPKRMAKLWRGGEPLALLAAGATPTAGQPVYRVFSGPDTGKSTTSSGQVNEIQTLTFANTTPAATVAGNFDALPLISFVDAGSDNANAAAFAAAMQGNAAYAGFTVSVALAVVTVEAADGNAHTFTDASDNPPNITAAVTQAAVAATAELVPNCIYQGVAGGDAGEPTAPLMLTLP